MSLVQLIMADILASVCKSGLPVWNGLFLFWTKSDFPIFWSLLKWSINLLAFKDQFPVWSRISSTMWSLREHATQHNASTQKRWKLTALRGTESSVHTWKQQISRRLRKAFPQTRSCVMGKKGLKQSQDERWKDRRMRTWNVWPWCSLSPSAVPEAQQLLDGETLWLAHAVLWLAPGKQHEKRDVVQWTSVEDWP